jgi:hypothetical protein
MLKTRFLEAYTFSNVGFIRPDNTKKEKLHATSQLSMILKTTTLCNNDGGYWMAQGPTWFAKRSESSLN